MTQPPRHHKTLKVMVLKPAEGMTWDQLGSLLRDTQYRAFRLANLFVSEAYLGFHMFRTGRQDEFERETIGDLNKRLRDMLVQEGRPPDEMQRFSRGGLGALRAAVVDSLSQNKLRGLTSGAKGQWAKVVRGESALPVFRRQMPVPIRCDRAPNSRLTRAPDGEVSLELDITLRPRPRVILATRKLDAGRRAILDRLLDNPEQKETGYRQRSFEVRRDNDGRWWLHVSYDFPPEKVLSLKPDVVVGVDLGVACPIYLALSNGHARRGRRHFSALAARIRSLQLQTFARRRDVQAGGRADLAAHTARSGHGRRRILAPTETLRGRIDNAYTTLNHQLSSSVIDFALNHSAGAVQMEDLSGLSAHLAGTFLGRNWRYHQLQQFIDYKAAEKGIEVRRVNPRFTSRRCSACGRIDPDFTRRRRDREGRPGYSARFVCPNPDCEHHERPVDADYNAARNLATLDIEGQIERQCDQQGIELSDKSKRGRR